MRRLKKQFGMAVIGSLMGAIALVGSAVPASATQVNSVVAAITGTVASSASSPLCVTGSTATFSGAALTGSFTAINSSGAGAAYVGLVNINAPVVATATSCALANVETVGALGAAPISGAVSTVESLTGTENGGSYIQLGNVAIASLSVSYTVNLVGRSGTATNVPVTAVVTATPIPPSFSSSVVAGAVAGAQLA